jgi:DNA-binding GntR family transcriptional regulator
MSDAAVDDSGDVLAPPDLTQQIRDAILGGDFAPHQRLIEADISERYDASRAAVRTALLNLANEGLVERLPNRGARVRAISIDEAVEIVEVRIGLETLCARKAAQNLNDADADGLRRLRDEISAAVASGNLMEYSRLNQEMDRRIRDLSRHATATRLLERLRAQSARHQFRLAFHPGRAAHSAPEHIAIIDALLARDADAAEAATRSHLEGIVSVLRGMD